MVVQIGILLLLAQTCRSSFPLNSARKETEIDEQDSLLIMTESHGKLSDGTRATPESGETIIANVIRVEKKNLVQFWTSGND